MATSTGLVLAGDDIQLQFARNVGKQPFFDSTTGVFFDGQKAYVYGELPAAQQFQYVGQSSAGQHLDVSTGLENSHFRVGNGTQGNLEEHASAPYSTYVMGN